MLRHLVPILLLGSLGACASTRHERPLTPEEAYAKQEAYQRLRQQLSQTNQQIWGMANSIGQQNSQYQAPEAQSYQRSDGTWVRCYRATDMMIRCTPY